MPIALPQIFFKTLKRMILKFIWHKKKPRIQFSIISKSKAHEGLAAPDIKRYYNAVILARMIAWTRSDKRWVKMENTLSRAQLGKNI